MGVTRGSSGFGPEASSRTAIWSARTACGMDIHRPQARRERILGKRREVRQFAEKSASLLDDGLRESRVIYVSAAYEAVFGRVAGTPLREGADGWTGSIPKTGDWVRTAPRRRPRGETPVDTAVYRSAAATGASAGSHDPRLPIRDSTGPAHRRVASAEDVKEVKESDEAAAREREAAFGGPCGTRGRVVQREDQVRAGRNWNGWSARARRWQDIYRRSPGGPEPATTVPQCS